MTLTELFRSESVQAAAWTSSERQMVCFELMSWSLTEQFLYADKIIGPDLIRSIQAIAKRACAGEPLSYILEVAYFNDLRLYVNSEVLIPRPDTEVLVKAASDWMAAMQHPRIHDLCTGTGAVALSLKARWPNATVTASDLMCAAVECAQRNADDLNLDVVVIKSDLFDSLGIFDLVTANPPYVAIADPEIDMSVRKYEPHKALYSGNDGLELMRRLLHDASSHVRSRGALFVEHGHRQAQLVRALALENGWSDIKTIQDLAGRDRVTRMHKP